MDTGSLIDMDIQDIISNNNPFKKNRELELTLHTEDKDIPIEHLKLFEVMRNYSKYVGDYIVVTFHMFGGEFIKDVYPYRDNLEMTITETNPLLDSITSTTRYKFVMLNNNANVYGSEYSASKREQLNRTKIIRVEGQLVDLVVEGLRLIQVDGIYKNQTIKNIITAELKEKIDTLQIDGETPQVNIDIVTPNNNNTIDQLVIPSGIYALDFPSYLQHSTYGVYNGDIGTYVQRINNIPTIFVYPICDINRFDEVEEKAMVFFTNNIKYNAIDNTFRKDGKILKILAGTSLRSLDDAENQFMSEGSGFIRAYPEQMMNRNVVVSDDKLQFESTANLEGTTFKERKDGSNRPIYVGNQVNMYKYRSTMTRRMMGTYQFQWHYSSCDMFYPGMPLQFVYEDGDGKIMELEGIVQVVYSKFDKILETTSTMITFFAKKPIVFEVEAK